MNEETIKANLEFLTCFEREKYSGNWRVKMSLKEKKRNDKERRGMASASVGSILGHTLGPALHCTIDTISGAHSGSLLVAYSSCSAPYLYTPLFRRLILLDLCFFFFFFSTSSSLKDFLSLTLFLSLSLSLFRLSCSVIALWRLWSKELALSRSLSLSNSMQTRHERNLIVSRGACHGRSGGGIGRSVGRSACVNPSFTLQLIYSISLSHRIK